jgi:hypothetical protein
MADAALDDAFTDLLQQVVDRHAVASRLQRTTRLADEVLATALRLGDGVRRALRAGERARPDQADCAQLTTLARRLEQATDAALSEDATRELRDAAARGRGEEAAELALTVFAGLTRPGALPPYVYLARTVRRRARSGETLVHPETLAREIAASSRDGVGPASGPARGDDGELPEPVALSPSFAGCGSEVALRLRTADLGPALLEDTASGDLLVFTDRVAGPFAVALAAEAEDEWWAASPLGWPSYRAGLVEALARLGVSVDVVE